MNKYSVSMIASVEMYGKIGRITFFARKIIIICLSIVLVHMWSVAPLLCYVYVCVLANASWVPKNLTMTTKPATSFSVHILHLLCQLYSHIYGCESEI